MQGNLEFLDFLDYLDFLEFLDFLATNNKEQKINYGYYTKS